MVVDANLRAARTREDLPDIINVALEGYKLRGQAAGLVGLYQRLDCGIDFLNAGGSVIGLEGGEVCNDDFVIRKVGLEVDRVLRRQR